VAAARRAATPSQAVSAPSGRAPASTCSSLPPSLCPLQQVPARSQDCGALRRRAQVRAHQDAGDREAQHRGRHARSRAGPDRVQAPQGGRRQALHPGRVRQDAGDGGHAQDGAADLHQDARGQAGHDVLRHALQGDQARVPQVHERTWAGADMGLFGNGGLARCLRSHAFRTAVACIEHREHCSPLPAALCHTPRYHDACRSPWRSTWKTRAS